MDSRLSLINKSSNVNNIAPSFSSGEIGTVDASTVVVTFSADMVSNNGDYKAGVTIKAGGVSKTISTGTRQTNHKVIRFVLSAPLVNGDTVTWEYAKSSGHLQGEVSGRLLENVTAQAVTNNIPA